MLNNEHTKMLFIKRIIVAYVKEKSYLKEQEYKDLSSKILSSMELVSKDLLSLGLGSNHSNEFYEAKSTFSYAVSCWKNLYNDAGCFDFLRRTFNASKPDELKIIIEEFMAYTKYPEGWAEEWPYVENE